MVEIPGENLQLLLHEALTEQHSAKEVMIFSILLTKYVIILMVRLKTKPNCKKYTTNCKDNGTNCSLDFKAISNSNTFLFTSTVFNYFRPSYKQVNMLLCLLDMLKNDRRHFCTKFTPICLMIYTM
jgi:hypothetical protein